MITLGYETSFDAAHRLFDYTGKCARLHGHTWKVRIELAGDVKPDGMVTDFNNIKALLAVTVDKYDHQDLTQFFSQPTCENIATRIFNETVDELYRQGLKDLALVSITVWESDHAYVRIG